MKLVAAIIKAFKLDAVRAALAPCATQALTVSEVRGQGNQMATDNSDGGAPAKLIPRLKIEVAVNAEALPRVLEAIQISAHTGKPGDGLIFILDLDQALRIRTGEAGPEAL